jgi:maltooligosyltrehalose trehalohydrolase
MQYAADISRPLGATWTRAGSEFRVWAPDAQSVEVRLVEPTEKLIPMTRDRRGYWSAAAPEVAPGARYFYRLRKESPDAPIDRPDPASRHQPDGVHGPSKVTGGAFAWADDAWRGIPLQKYILYELHIGAFTLEGTFDAAIARLPDLVELGVTAIEIMPVAQFAGDRNWGYDGVLPFAVQDSYGGPDGLKRLVDAAHRAGLAVVLDVVYNHLGPEGNYLSDFGPYFTDRYRSPWGMAMNFDGPGSDEVRRYFIENAAYWLRDFHIDALRLDAVHAMLDFSAGTFLEELAAVVAREAVELNRQVFLIAESDLNDARVVRTTEEHGFGLDAQWADDLHHALHALLTGERQGYYEDFAGAPGQAPSVRLLAAALADGVIYQGQYAPARGRRHGNSFAGIPGRRLVVCSQNHDQVGNRMMGDRLATLVSPARLKLAAAVVLLSPYLPLLFMGEEYGETNPFLYFISHSDLDLVKAVQQGRKEEFAAFMAGHEGEPPDPAAPETFARSKLDWDRARHNRHAELRELYKSLIGLRKAVPALRQLSKESQEVIAFEDERAIAVRRWFGESQALAVFNFSEQDIAVRVPAASGLWCRAAASDLSAAGEFVVEDGRAEVRLKRESFALYVGGGMA